MSVLEVSDLSIRFGGLQALEGVTLQVNEWEIVGLIGPNGAGKTTAFNCITGFYKPDTGVVRYRGADVTRVPPHEKAALGFGRTFQNVGMVKSATALENLKTAQHAKIAYDAWGGLAGSGLSWREERELEVKAEAVLDLLGLSEIRNRLVGGLPYGTLKLLELGCALATDPDVLLLDEPSSGMGPEESDELGERLLRLRQEFGLTMLLIEHHVPLVLRVCDHVYVLNFGRLLAEGEPSVIQTHPEVVAAYLGGEAPDALAATEETDEQAALDAGYAAPAPAGRKPAAKKPAAKKPAAKKAPAKKAAAKKAAAKKAAAKKTAAKKTAAKKTAATRAAQPPPDEPETLPGVAATAPIEDRAQS
ncbi:MAG: ABC transporter ATP-binding protein [Mycobacteriales bacterium]